MVLIDKFVLINLLTESTGDCVIQMSKIEHPHFGLFAFMSVST